MSQKAFAQNSEIVNVPSLASVNRRNIILIILATILVIALAFVVAGQNPDRNEAINSDPVSTIPYSNALELQYAQPWLRAGASAFSELPFSNALEMQYAQPYLGASASAVNEVLCKTDYQVV